MLATKQCSKCKEIKELAAFYPNKSTKSGYRSECIICSRNASNKWEERNIKSRYDLTNNQYFAMLEAQNHVCAICNQPETAKFKNGKVKKLSVDHCHKTNKVRGLLCNHCNRALGYLKDNPVFCHAAGNYLSSKSDII